MKLFLTMQLALAMVACAASSPSFLQVQPQRGAAFLDDVPSHLLDLDGETLLEGKDMDDSDLDIPVEDLLKIQDPNEDPMTKRIRKIKKIAAKRGIFVWNLCTAEVHSNLGGLGPDSGPQELRFKAIGEFEGKTFDLVFLNTTAYHAWDVHRNTARGCFGVINVAHDSSVELIASFFEEGTYTPMHIGSHFAFSVFDNDCSLSGCEELEMITPEADLEDMCIDQENELQMAVEEDQAGYLHEDFQATHEGFGSDNPPPVGAVQKDRAVTFKLQRIKSFRMILRVHHSKQGRNFLFAGATKICQNKKILTPPTPPPTCVEGQCAIWGDPHIISFDVSAKRKRQHPLREAFFRTRGWKSDQLSIYDEGTFWLVKSQRVHIQARYWHNKTHPDWTSLGALAVGGPFLGNNTLVLRPLAKASTWNGQEILSTLYSGFSNEYIRAKYRPDAELVKNGKFGPGVEMALPDGVSLTVNRWMQSLAVKISMCAQAGGQEGQCGNFNGIAHDDTNDTTKEFRVSQSEWLF